MTGIFTTPAGISGIRTLHTVNYAFVSVVGVWVYDFALTVGEEVNFVLHARWQIGKLLYLLCRYLPFAMISVDIFRVVHPNISHKSCATCFGVSGFTGGFELCCAEALFILRIWALSSRKRRTLIIILCNYLLFLTAMVVIVKTSNSTSIVLDTLATDIVVCYNRDDSHIIIFASVLLVIGEIEIFAYMLYRSWKLHRDLGNNLPIVRILIRHNAFYFACGLFSSTMVIVTKLTLTSASHASFADIVSNLQIVLHGILATRMHRELWNTRNHRRITSEESVPLVVFAAPPVRRT